MENEVITKDIPGFEDYTIDTLGRVYSKKKKIYMAQSLHNGYPLVSLYKGGKQSAKAVHRLIATAFILNPKNKPCVDHINRIKTDNRIENLRWVTHSENRQNTSLRSDNKLGIEGICEVTRNNGKNLYYYAHIALQNKKEEKLFPRTEIGLIEAIAWRMNKKSELHIQ